MMVYMTKLLRVITWKSYDVYDKIIDGFHLEKL